MRAHLATAATLPLLLVLLSCRTSNITAAPVSNPVPQPSLRAAPASDTVQAASRGPNNPNDGSDSTFDYIVVGAGNAGAVVAARLSEDPRVRVLLLEEGTFSQDSQGQGRRPDWIVEQISTPRYDYRTWAIPALTQQIYTEANPALNNRSGILVGPVVTGKALGGSTVVNIGAYTRPGPDYFDCWGLENWSGEEAVRYFRKLEDHEDPRAEYGKGGPVHVEHGDAQTVYPYLHQASLSMDPPLQTNSAGRLSYGLPQVYRVVKEGRRLDAYTSYLRPALGRSNLVIRTGARVERVVFDENKRAVGVEYSVVIDMGGTERVQFGQERQRQQANVDVRLLMRAHHEVVLCAGVFFTPHILLKSGVGPKEHLEAAGIPVVADLPGVGRNLLARIDVLFFYGNGSVVPEMNPFVLRDDATATFYQEQHRGPYSLGALGIYTVVKGRFPGEKDYVMFMTDVIPEVAPRMFALGCSNLRVHAPGRVELPLENPDGAKHPHIHLNMMASEEDRKAVRQCLRDVRDMMAEPAMVSRGFKETFPTRALVDNTDAALDRWIRTGFSFYSWHATGTAKMAAATDPLGVLDERLRVRGGVTGLRVADASAVPDMIEAGPMATLYMVGERAADLIKEDHERQRVKDGDGDDE